MNAAVILVIVVAATAPPPLDMALPSPAALADERVTTQGVPVVNRLDDDGTYVTWSLILRHENGRTTLAYESGGNRDLLKRAHAAVESARLLRRRVTVEGLCGPQAVILVERIVVGRDAFVTDQDDPLEDAILEAEAIEALQPNSDIDAVPTRIADLDGANGRMVKIAGTPIANVFKHTNGQGIWNVLLSDGAATVLAYESGENVDQLSRLAALVDLALAEKRPLAFVGRYDREQQVLELSLIEMPNGVRYLTDLGEAGAAGAVAPDEPRVLRTVEPLIDEFREAPVYLTPDDDVSIEYEYLTPTYVETPVPVVVERQVIIEHHYWVFPEIIVVARGPGRFHRRPHWSRSWRAWTFCPRSHFDRRWHHWHVRRHPAYFNFCLWFSWHDRDDDRSRRDGHHRRGASSSHGGRREEILRRALAFARARRRASEQHDRRRHDRRREDRDRDRPRRERRTPPTTVRTPRPVRHVAPSPRPVKRPIQVTPVRAFRPAVRNGGERTPPHRVGPQRKPPTVRRHQRTTLSRDDVQRRKTIEVRLPAPPRRRTTPTTTVTPSRRVRRPGVERNPARRVDADRPAKPVPIRRPKPVTITRHQRTTRSRDDVQRRKTIEVRLPAPQPRRAVKPRTTKRTLRVETRRLPTRRTPIVPGSSRPEIVATTPARSTRSRTRASSAKKPRQRSSPSARRSTASSSSARKPARSASRRASKSPKTQSKRSTDARRRKAVEALRKGLRKRRR